MKYLVIDSGTTTSRVRLTNSESILTSVKREVGARDVAISGDTKGLKNALKECIEEILSNQRMGINEIDAIIASGMISSNMGLVEIPHLQGPVGLEQLSSSLVRISFPEIAEKPIFFVPGIKTGFQHDSEIGQKDMMRGEEAEIFGYLNSLEDHESNDILFMHYGSHHKCILVRNHQISECYTSITGELMMAIAQNTILKSSLLPISDVSIDPDWVLKGLEIAESSGFGRALFSTRVLDTIEKKDLIEVTNFYLGTLLYLDLAMVSTLINNETKSIVLYGKELYPSLFTTVLNERYPSLQVQTVPEALSDLLSAKGAVKIYSEAVKQR